MSGQHPGALTAKSGSGAGDDHPSAGQVETLKHLVGGRRVAVLAHGRGLSRLREWWSDRGRASDHCGAPRSPVAVSADRSNTL